MRNAAAWCVIALAAGLAPGTGPSAARARAAPIQELAPRLLAVNPGKPAAFSGSVLGPDGRPAGDVQVFYAIRDGFPWGQVVAEAKTDASGRFRVECLGGAGDGTHPWSVSLWAYRRGDLVGAELAWGDSLPEGSEVRLTVGPPARSAFRIRAPDGSPVAGARLQPRVLKGRALAVPTGLAERIEEEGPVSDADGRIVLTALHTEEIVTLFVSAKGYGRQQFGFDRNDDEPGPRTITLLPVGRVTGRLVGPPDQIRGRGLSVGTSTPGRPSPYAGSFSVVTDAEGRFDVPEIAAGNVRVSLNPPDIRSPWLIRSEPGSRVEAGRTTEVEITLKRGVPVVGFVREEGTGAPVAGVGVSLVAFAGGISATTGEDGRYTGFLPPGRMHLFLDRVPGGHARPNFGLPQLAIPEGDAELELPPILLSRAATVRGIAVDDRGRGLPGATVTASWPVGEGPNRVGRAYREFLAGAGGRFLIPGVPIDSEVRLVATHRGLSTPEPVTARSGEDREARLALDAGLAAALSGRVLDADGRPLSGARVRLRRKRDRALTPFYESSEAVEFPGSPPLVTDAEGRFATPATLIADGQYAAYADAEGHDSARTAWTAGSAGAFPDLRLDRETRPATAGARD